MEWTWSEWRDNDGLWWFLYELHEWRNGVQSIDCSASILSRFLWHWISHDGGSWSGVPEGWRFRSQHSPTRTRTMERSWWFSSGLWNSERSIWLFFFSKQYEQGEEQSSIKLTKWNNNFRKEHQSNRREYNFMQLFRFFMEQSTRSASNVTLWDSSSSDLYPNMLNDPSESSIWKSMFSWKSWCCSIQNH